MNQLEKCVSEIIEFENKSFLEPLDFRIDLVNRAGYKIDNLIINNERISIDKLTRNDLLVTDTSLISMNDDSWVEIKNIDHLELSFTISDYNDEIRNNYYFANYLKVNDLINETIIVTPINSNCIRCYSKFDINEEKLLFEYNWSRLEKIKRKLISNQ